MKTNPNDARVLRPLTNTMTTGNHITDAFQFQQVMNRRGLDRSNRNDSFFHNSHGRKNIQKEIYDVEEESTQSCELEEGYSFDDKENNDKRIITTEKEEEEEEGDKEILNEVLEPIVLLRQASENNYKGEGFEITDWNMKAVNVELENRTRKFEYSRNDLQIPQWSDSFCLQTWSLGSNCLFDTDDFIFESDSDDETDSTDDASHNSSYLRSDLVDLSSSLEEFNSLPSKNLNGVRDTSSDNIVSPLVDDEVKRSSNKDSTTAFVILGTSASDVRSTPHVLSPPLMQSLQHFLPFSKSSDNFWMRYSLVRDGASTYTFLQQVRGAKYSIIALETTDGEVFGAFTSHPWRKTWGYYGNGESFLWNIQSSRKEIKKNPKGSIGRYNKQIEGGSINVYPFAGENNYVQLCNHDKLAVGAGIGNPKDTNFQPESGFGLCIYGDMNYGTTSPCLTFRSPSLSDEHSDGSAFEIANLELWSLTPCAHTEDAENLERGLIFLEQRWGKKY